MPRNRLIKFALLLTLPLALALGLARPAAAVEFTNDGIIEAGEVVEDDLFISTDVVQIDGDVNGDLFINSSTATINGLINGNLIVTTGLLQLNGTVKGSIIFAGQEARLNGPVDGSLYAAGNSVHLEPKANLTRNVYFLGFSLETEPGSTIERDLLLNAYQGLLSGSVARDLQADLGALELAGSVGRNVNLVISGPGEGEGFSLYFPWMSGAPTQGVPSGLRVQETATIGGALYYKSRADQAASIASQPAGGVTFELNVEEATPVTRRELFINWLAGRVREMVTLLILAALAIWLLPSTLPAVTQVARRKLLPATGWGILLFFLSIGSTFFLAFLILLLSILIWAVTLSGLANAVFGIGFAGLSLAVAIFAFMLFLGSKLVVAHLIGRLILERLAPAAAEHRAWPLVLGLLIYVPLRGIPGFGFLIGLFVTLFGLGAIWLAWRSAYNQAALQAITPQPA